jgi:hypothetical protein
MCFLSGFVTQCTVDYQISFTQTNSQVSKMLHSSSFVSFWLIESSFDQSVTCESSLGALSRAYVLDFTLPYCFFSLSRTVSFLVSDKFSTTPWYLHLQEYSNVTPTDKQATPLFLCFQSTATLVCSWSGKCRISSKTTQLYTNKQRPSPISVRHD